MDRVSTYSEIPITPTADKHPATTTAIAVLGAVALLALAWAVLG